MTRPQTLGSLRDSGYLSRSIKSEMRENVVRKLRAGEPLFPGILGYDDTVIPQIVNALLSQHDMLFLGLRGQGKTRMLRMLTSLLDDEIPIVAGSEINDDPFAPISRFARDLVASKGDETPIQWVGRDARYHEKLATPDVTIADLIGEIDLMKHAEGRHLASEEVLHFGLIPRSHRGIFCINELPDLAPKIQVGLFNVLEERDVQIRGFTVRLPLDLCLVFSANPEDYTNRGRIVTPLKDRIGSVIRTHYPVTRSLGMEITRENAYTARDSGVTVHVPRFIEEIVEETSRLARVSPHVNQASGVSVRMSVANYENVISNAERRALLCGETTAVARPADLQWLPPSSRGKVELTIAEEGGEEDRLIQRLVEEATKVIFDQRLTPKMFRSVIEFFEQGGKVNVTGNESAAEFLKPFDKIPGFRKQLQELAAELDPPTQTIAPNTTIAGHVTESLRSNAAQVEEARLASVAEFLLDALYAHNRLNRKPQGTITQYGS
ncbi:MAG: sigma 54-interacting transcriptional regulator [Planctomycetaceae bacterium]